MGEIVCTLKTTIAKQRKFSRGKNIHKTGHFRSETKELIPKRLRHFKMISSKPDEVVATVSWMAASLLTNIRA